jgi:Fe-S cluster biogenesis protein NfuA
MAGEPRLDGPALGEHLARLDTLLEQVEQAPGPSGRAAVAAVQALTALYGEALARVLDLAGPEVAARLAGDELLSHLLVLHELHPEPAERRAATAVEGLREALRERGGDAELLGVEDGVATVRVSSGKGCRSSSAPVEDAVREAVLAAAPELTEVRPVAPPSGSAFVPLETVLPRRAPTGGPR